MTKESVVHNQEMKNYDWKNRISLLRNDEIIIQVMKLYAENEM